MSKDLAITGDLVSAGDIQIDGQVKGDVAADTLTIGEQGQVEGKVRGERVRVCGTVEGEIEGGTVTLAASARVQGDVVHDSLAIEPGARLEGHCRRRAATTAAQPATRETAAKTAPVAEKDAASGKRQSGAADKDRAFGNGTASNAT
ncbi:bactofilin family protein [Rhodovibrio salinarum]|uniref:bactofilin family protein n=1 Tax=Rhodovibrio salinarum TaxID=1087 RepID=UPI0004AC8058|nr:polymer-forming cytoskeletal protein [Rhodovibrio salinarum]